MCFKYASDLKGTYCGNYAWFSNTPFPLDSWILEYPRLPHQPIECISETLINGQTYTSWEWSKWVIYRLIWAACCWLLETDFKGALCRRLSWRLHYFDDLVIAISGDRIHYFGDLMIVVSVDVDDHIPHSRSISIFSSKLCYTCCYSTLTCIATHPLTWGSNGSSFDLFVYIVLFILSLLSSTHRFASALLPMHAPFLITVCDPVVGTSSSRDDFGHRIRSGIISSG